MGAKAKLNGSYANGALLFAGAIGLATGSWAVFVVAFAIFFATSYWAGDIRK